MNTNFMVAATEKFIKVWDIEFGSLKYKHQLKYKFLFFICAIFVLKQKKG